MAFLEVSSAPPTTPAQGTGSSVLEDIVELVVGHGPFEISFEDITGFTYDVPEFALADRRRAHCSEFCCHAKENQGRRRECVINKWLCNRKACRGTGFSGMCHLGMMEYVEPLCVSGKTMGVFYFGSVVVEGREEEAGQKIVAYCKRRRLSPDGYLAALRAAPKVSAAEWEKGKALFLRAVRLASAFVESIGLPIESYTIYGIRRDAAQARSISSLTKSAMAYVRKNYTLPCRLVTAAKALGCHPVHLSRIFKKDLGINFNEFVHRVRISHAKRLLRVNAMNATRVSYEVGFCDSSHFNRIFQRQVGQTPGEFARNGNV